MRRLVVHVALPKLCAYTQRRRSVSVAAARGTDRDFHSRLLTQHLRVPGSLGRKLEVAKPYPEIQHAGETLTNHYPNQTAHVCHGRRRYLAQRLASVHCAVDDVEQLVQHRPSNAS